MLFIDYLKNYLAGDDYVRNEWAIEAKFKEKLPHILTFISGREFSDLSFKFYTRRYEAGCVFTIEGDSFELTSIHHPNKKEFTCEIQFKIKLNFMDSSYVNCRFDEDLNIKDFSYQINFGSFGSGNSLFIENTKYFDGNYKRKIYLQSVSDHSISVIENLNMDIHKENLEFEDFLSKVLLINFYNPDIYRDAFHYLPAIDMKNTDNMGSFINQLHERHIRKDVLIIQSFNLLDMYKV
jgi:hypothetical protein